LTGHFLLRGHQNLTAHLMVFASGGILYLLIQDIIPKSKFEKNYLTSLGATLGFLAGVIAEKLV
jgi:ZIP family zinc transporter